MGCCWCCQPMPVLWLTNCDCRNGFVVPVGWGARVPALVAGRCCCSGAPKPLAKGFVPVAMGCRGAACGGADWKAGLDGAPLGEARAKGLVDVCCGCRAFGGPVGAGCRPFCWPVIIIDARNGFVTCCCGLDMDDAPVGNDATASCGMGASELWKPDCCDVKPPNPAPVNDGCNWGGGACCCCCCCCCG